MSEFDGRVTLVTGAGGGIGRVVACEFARSGAQGRRDRCLAAGSRGDRRGDRDGWAPIAVVRKMDVTSDGEVRRDRGELSAAVGPIGSSSNCAGVSSMAPFLQLTEQDWDLNMDVNAKGVFLVTREVVRSMVTRREGCVVSIASAAGKEGTPVPGALFRLQVGCARG